MEHDSPGQNAQPISISVKGLGLTQQWLSPGRVVETGKGGSRVECLTWGWSGMKDD